MGIPDELYHPILRLRLCSPNESATFDFPEPAGSATTCAASINIWRARRSSRVRGSRPARGLQTDPRRRRGDGLCWVPQRGCSSARFAQRSSSTRLAYRAELSRLAGLQPGFDRFGVGAEYELIAPNCRQDEALLLVGNRYAPAGYAWVFPWGAGRVRVGVGLLHSDTREDARKLITSFIDDLHTFGVDVRGCEITEKHFGLIPAVGLAPRLAGDGIMAAGDAAGVATLVVGEGIRLSMVSGEMAGSAAVSALAQGRADAAVLGDYETRFRAKFAHDLRIGTVINKRIASWTDAKWDEGVAFCARSRRARPSRCSPDFSARDVVPWLAAVAPRAASWRAGPSRPSATTCADDEPDCGAGLQREASGHPARGPSDVTGCPQEAIVPT